MYETKWRMTIKFDFLSFASASYTDIISNTAKRVVLKYQQ